MNERGADELRVRADSEPQMFAGGVPRRLSIPKMSRRDVQDLLGELLSAERKARVAAGEALELLYDSVHGSFHVTLSGEGGISAIFVKGTQSAAATSPESPSTAAVSAPDAACPSAPPPSPPTPAPVASEDAKGGACIPLVLEAERLRASDLHLADGQLPMVRVDGDLRPVSRDRVGDVSAVLGLSPEQRNVLATRGSLDFSAQVDGVGVVRVHAFRSAEAVSAAVRLLPGFAPPLASLGMPVALDDLVMLPHGLVIACGPSGAGKSTTLAALAQEALKRRSIVLVTLEDPIEYGLVARENSLVRRRQVGRDVATFATGLRDALREDPDVLVVGEMRDPETIALALTAAETGHLVLGSIHSRSAASAVQRIFDAYPPERQPHIRSQLAEVLRAVVAQRLVRRASGPGRVAVAELLRVTTAVANTVREGRTAQLASLIQAGRRDGMLSLERCLADRVRAGEITMDEARNAAFDVGTLTMYLND